MQALSPLPLALGASFHAPLFLLLILALADLPQAAFRTRGWRPFVVLGEASYAVYILQIPVHHLYGHLIEPRLALGETVHLGLYLLTLVTVSVLAWRFIERPVGRWLKSKGPQPKAADPKTAPAPAGAPMYPAKNRN
ncbi:MAG: hypothetical protein R3E96_14590 [Planctomycetota bacterium]